MVVTRDLHDAWWSRVICTMHGGHMCLEAGFRCEVLGTRVTLERLDVTETMNR